MRKRGQISLFIILGILLLITLSFMFFLTKMNVQRSQRSEFGSTISLTSTQSRVEHLVQSCFEQLAQQLIFSAGTYAGYSVFFTPRSSTYIGLPYRGFTVEPTPTRIIVYLYAEEEKRLPSEIELEQTMETALNHLFLQSGCLNDFIELRDEGWDVSGTEIDSTVDISDNGISLELSFPRIFSKDGDSFQINTFTFESHINFFTYLSFADELINSLTTKLSSLQSELEPMVARGEMTQEQAAIYAQEEVNKILEAFTVQLHEEGYDFYYRESPNILDNHLEPGTFFFIRDRKTDFEFIFGGAL